MAEALENGVADMSELDTDVSGAVKQQMQQMDHQKHNGMKDHHQDAESPSTGSESKNKTDDFRNDDEDNTDLGKNKSNESKASDNEDGSDQSNNGMESESNETKEAVNNENDDSNHLFRKHDRNAKEEDTMDSVSNMEEQSRDASESMDVDNSSNFTADENSNVASYSGQIHSNITSNNPSVMSEDSSRDSVDTIESKSEDADDSSLRDGLVSKVKDADGEDILITLNDEENSGDKDNENSSDVLTENEKNDSIKKTSSRGKETNAEGTKNQNLKKTNNDQNKAKQPVSSSTSQPPASSLAITTGGQTFLISSDASIPVGAQLIRQGNHLGYVTIIGNQSLFVPVSNLSQAVPVANLTQSVTKPQVTVVPQKPVSQIKETEMEELKPKSSMEMIELMKWEIQNRIPDNSNWSVAFHPKKEELSSITSFLLELGHDVVKEAVYKDIIQIQTKKKDSGELKENEIESLEKMKTVYENTRKKVEHLQLQHKQCDGCEFKTESTSVMNLHKDFPHYDPPWDTSHGWMACAHCDYRTKAAAQFSFHMSAMHNAEAKLPDKMSLFQCELCPLNTTTMNKLERHRLKCTKHFKMSVNLHPYYHDVNFCMKTCYYKPRKISAQKPIIHSKPQTPQLPNVPVSSNRAMTPTPQPPRLVAQSSPAVRAQGLPRPPPLQQMQPKIQPQKPGSISQPRPSIATARSSVPPAPRTPSHQSRPVRPQGKEMAGFEVCELCGGYVKDRQALRIHFYYAHKVEMPQTIFNQPVRPLTCEVCQSKFWTTQGLTKHKTTLRHYASPAQSTSTASTTPGTNQQCFMCMRKVTNLFIHIENVHGMTMKDLVAMKKCIICGLTAVDRKNLEVHMASTHGVLIKANEFLGSEKQSSKPLTPIQTNPPKPPAPNPAGVPVGRNMKPSIKQNLCVFCQLQFADNIQLTMHCIKNHATCSGCGMVVQSNKHLNNHNCRQMKRHCDICGMKNISPDTYVEHVKKLHMKPCKVEVDKMSDNQIDEVRDKIKREYKPAIISLDSEEDSDVELVDSDSQASTKSNVKAAFENKENENSMDVSDTAESGQAETDENPKSSFSLKSEMENEECNGGRSEGATFEPAPDGHVKGDNVIDENGTRKRKHSGADLDDDDGNKKYKIDNPDQQLAIPKNENEQTCA